MGLGVSEEERCKRFFCFHLDPRQLRAALTVLPSCGHLPHVERPEALANTVLKYLDRSAPRA